MFKTDLHLLQVQKTKIRRKGGLRVGSHCYLCDTVLHYPWTEGGDGGVLSEKTFEKDELT